MPLHQGVTRYLHLQAVYLPVAGGNAAHGKRVPKLRKTADAEIRCRDIDLLTLFALKQVIQHVAEAIFDVVDDVRYAHIQ